MSDVAHMLDAPFVVARKERLGDREVTVDLPGIDQWKGCTPVLVDDIISSGHTMAGVLHQLVPQAFQPPICIGVHGIFADRALATLHAAGAGRIVTCNSIVGDTALIDISADVAAALAEVCGNPGH